MFGAGWEFYCSRFIGTRERLYRLGFGWIHMYVHTRGGCGETYISTHIKKRIWFMGGGETKRFFFFLFFLLAWSPISVFFSFSFYNTRTFLPPKRRSVIIHTPNFSEKFMLFGQFQIKRPSPPCRVVDTSLPPSPPKKTPPCDISRPTPPRQPPPP